MEKAYKFRFYPTKKQEVLIAKTFGCARFAYNYTLAARKEAYSNKGISLSGYDCIKMLPRLKTEYPWLNFFPVGQGMPEPIRLGTLRKTSLDEGGDGRTKNPPTLAVGSVKNREFPGGSIRWIIITF